MELPLEYYYRVSEIQLSYVSKIKASNRPTVTCSEDSHRIFRRYWDDARIDFIEESKLLLLNRANAVLGIYDLSTGTTTGTLIDPRMVLMAALKANASGIILAHNHPSDNLQPNTADRDTTDKLREAGNLFSISVFDHIILGRSGYYSLADEEFHPSPAPKLISFAL